MSEPRQIEKQKDTIKLSDHFTYKRLLRFTWPAMMMSLFGSIYGIVDGYFVSNYAGDTALTAVNLVFPPMMILASVGFMLGGGGAALVGKVLGERDHKRANEYFSLVTYGTIVIGLITTLILFLWMPSLGVMLKAKGVVLEQFILYGRILTVTLVPYMLQYHFHTFLITAEKPHLGLVFTVAAGVTNMVLDFLLVGVFKWGLVGAALATDIAQCVGGLIPMVWFFMPNDSLLRLGKTHWDGFCIGRSFYNGISSFLSNAASSLVGLVTNYELMKFAGDEGVAAYGVIMYCSWVFTAIFFGYCSGTAPIVAYHYGAVNHYELANILRKSFIFEMIACVLAAILNYVFAGVMTRLFVGYNPELTAFTIHAFKIYSLSYICTGFGFFSQVFFTALNNGLVAGIITFTRLFVLQMGLTIVMGEMFGEEGLWWAMVLAQTLGFVVGCFFIWKNRHKYHYLDKNLEPPEGMVV